MSRPRTPPSPDVLSTREGEVADLVAAGLPNKVIARQLGISPETVKKHLSRSFVKLEVSNRVQFATAWRVVREQSRR